jgi:hypothetical protein
MGFNLLTAWAATMAGPTHQPPYLPCLDAPRAAHEGRGRAIVVRPPPAGRVGAPPHLLPCGVAQGPIPPSFPVGMSFKGSQSPLCRPFAPAHAKRATTLLAMPLNRSSTSDRWCTTDLAKNPQTRHHRSPSSVSTTTGRFSC